MTVSVELFSNPPLNPVWMRCPSARYYWHKSDCFGLKTRCIARAPRRPAAAIAIPMHAVCDSRHMLCNLEWCFSQALGGGRRRLRLSSPPAMRRRAPGGCLIGGSKPNVPRPLRPQLPRGGRPLQARGKVIAACGVMGRYRPGTAAHPPTIGIPGNEPDVRTRPVASKCRFSHRRPGCEVQVLDSRGFQPDAAYGPEARRLPGGKREAGCTSRAGARLACSDRARP